MTRLQKYTWIIFLVISAWHPTLSAQTRFITELDSREVIATEAFQIRFTVENGKPSNFRPPDWNGLEVIQGPSRSMQTSFINGQMSSQTSFIFLVSAPKPGKYTIGSAVAEIDNREWTTDPVAITAVNPGNTEINEEDLGKPYFVVAKLDTNEAFVGQQVLLEFRLYTRVEVNSYDILKAPSFQGIYFRNLPLFDRRARRETVDGKEYNTQILRKVALFPQQSGKIVIDPMYFQLGVVDRSERRSFFFSSRIRPVRLNSDPVELTVKKVPSPAPKGFCGAVGSLALSARWDKSRCKVNDAVSLTMTVSTDSDPKQLVAPELDFGDAFEVYPPNLVNSESNETSGKSLINKTWEYILVPQKAGQYQMAFDVSYFNTDSINFEKVKAGAWNLTVLPGAYSPSQNKTREDANAKIHSPALASEHQPRRSLWWGTLGYWLIFCVPVFAGLVLFRIKSMKDREFRTAAVDRNYKKAKKRSQGLLADAKKAMKEQNDRLFYKCASEAFIGYAAHRLKVSPNNVTRNDMRNYLGKADIDAELIDRFIAFWDKLDTAQYAPAMMTGGLEDIYKQAIELMSELEATLEKV